jgi:hypothetical protein
MVSILLSLEPGYYNGGARGDNGSSSTSLASETYTSLELRKSVTSSTERVVVRFVVSSLSRSIVSCLIA